MNGPRPIFHSYNNRRQEMEGIGRHIKHLIEVDGISPTGMCLIYNGRVGRTLESQLGPILFKLGVELSLQRNRAFQRKSNTLIATTPHSYKGYESEAVIIPSVDTFVAPDGQILAHALYVAMTRARSLLAIYGTHGGPKASTTIVEAVERCLETQRTRPTIDLQEESDLPIY